MKPNSQTGFQIGKAASGFHNQPLTIHQWPKVKSIATVKDKSTGLLLDEWEHEDGRIETTLSIVHQGGGVSIGEGRALKNMLKE